METLHQRNLYLNICVYRGMSRQIDQVDQYKGSILSFIFGQYWRHIGDIWETLETYWRHIGDMLETLATYSKNVSNIFETYSRGYWRHIRKGV